MKASLFKVSCNTTTSISNISTPINGFLPIDSDEDLIVSDGKTFLKTGVLNTDVMFYPNTNRNSVGIGTHITNLDSTFTFEYVDSADVTVGTNVYAICFSEDGLHLYSSDASPDYTTWYDLTVPFDTSTAVYMGVFDHDIDNIKCGNAKFCQISPDGTKYILAGSGDDNILEFTLSTPWDITTATLTFDIKQELLASSYYGNITLDGTKLYLIDDSELVGVSEYKITTPWDISTLTFVKNINTELLTRYTSQTTVSSLAGLISITFSLDGHKLITLDTSENLDEFYLPTPFDLTDFQHRSNIKLDTLGVDSSITTLKFIDDTMTEFYCSSSSLNRPYNGILIPDVGDKYPTFDLLTNIPMYIRIK